MGYTLESSDGSSLFSSSQLAFRSYSNLNQADALSCICCFSKIDCDPLQCFFPSPFSFSSLSAFLPASSSNYPPSTCLASVSVADSVRRRISSRKTATGHAPVQKFSSALGFLLQGGNRKSQEAVEGSPNSDRIDEVHKTTDFDSSRSEREESKLRVETVKTSKHLLAGAMSAAISRTLVAPLERLKLEYILRGATEDVPEVVRMIFSSEGLKGFWKGNLVNIIRTAPFKSINFYAYDTIRKRITAITGRKEITNFEKLAAGATAGILATILCFPMDTIRTRMVAPGGEAMGGIIGCFRHIINNQGLSSLYAGLVPAVISMAPASAVFYGVYDILKTGYLSSPAGQEEAIRRGRRNGPRDQMELDPLRTLLYGAIAGVCSETVTYPLEVVRRHLQMQDAASRLNLLRTVQGLVQQGGVGALYAGLFPSTLQVLPSAALSYFIYEWLKVSLKVS